MFLTRAVVVRASGVECVFVPGDSCGGLGMFSTALNTLVSVRTVGLKLIHKAEPDGFASLLVGLTLVGVVIWAVSRHTQSSA